MRTQSGDLNGALAAAGSAAAREPANAHNHHALALARQRMHQMGEAGNTYLESTSRGLPGTNEEIGFNGLLQQVRRDRQFFGTPRLAHHKLIAGGGVQWLARSPNRASIFDPHKGPYETGKPFEPAPVLSAARQAGSRSGRR